MWHSLPAAATAAFVQHLLPDPDPVPLSLPLPLPLPILLHLHLHWLNLSAQIPAAFSLFDRCCCCCCLLLSFSQSAEYAEPNSLMSPLHLLFPKQVQKTVSSAPSRVVVPPERPLIKEVVEWLERAFCLRYVKLPVVKLRFIWVWVLLLPLLYYFSSFLSVFCGACLQHRSLSALSS